MKRPQHPRSGVSLLRAPRGARRIAGLSCALAFCLCWTTFCATPPARASAGDPSRPASGFLTPGSFEASSAFAPRELLTAEDPGRTSVLERESEVLEDRSQSLTEFARKVSYAGVLLLTADRIVRSMDSVMERMQLRCDDGTRVRLDVSPQSQGMEMMVRISRPIGF